MKLLGSLLIHCVFTKKTEGEKKGRKFVKIETGKNIGSPEQCAVVEIFYQELSSPAWLFFIEKVGSNTPFVLTFKGINWRPLIQPKSYVTTLRARNLISGSEIYKRFREIRLNLPINQIIQLFQHSLDEVRIVSVELTCKRL